MNLVPQINGVSNELQALFERCVLWKGCPSTPLEINSDLDLLVPTETYPQISYLLKQNRWLLRPGPQPDPFSTHFINPISRAHLHLHLSPSLVKSSTLYRLDLNELVFRNQTDSSTICKTIPSDLQAFTYHILALCANNSTPLPAKIYRLLFTDRVYSTKYTKKISSAEAQDCDTSSGTVEVPLLPATIQQLYSRILSASRLNRIFFPLKYISSIVEISRPSSSEIKRGCLVSIIGCDGSGKSTLSKSLTSHLTTLRLDPILFQFGMRHNPKGLTRLVIYLLIKSTNAFKLLQHPTFILSDYPRNRCVANIVTSFLSSHPILFAIANSLSTHLDALRWCVLALSRRQTVSSANRHISAGGIAVFDRYYFKQTLEMSHPMDGPRIKCTDSSSSLLCFLADFERRIYQSLPRPDLTICLYATPDVLYRRHTDSEEDLTQKISAINNVIRTSPSVRMFNTEILEPDQVLYLAISQLTNCINDH